MKYKHTYFSVTVGTKVIHSRALSKILFYYKEELMFYYFIPNEDDEIINKLLSDVRSKKIKLIIKEDVVAGSTSTIFSICSDSFMGTRRLFEPPNSKFYWVFKEIKRL